MENINFIPANELPEAEGDEVSVLCVENGELKQKSASGLGGNTNYDIVVRLVGSWDAEADQRSATAELMSGSFDAVVQKLDAGIIPVGLAILTGQSWDGVEIKAVDEFIPSWEKHSDEDEGYLYVDTMYFSGRFYADGTFEFD